MKFLRMEEIDPIEDHWDISVEGNNNFYANGVLVHNSNGAVCYNEELGFWVQSKTAVLEIGKDNAGCAFANTPLEPQWVEIIRSLADEYGIDLKKKIIAVYFEWCGKGIQKSTAVAGLEKRAMVFSYFKVAPREHSEDEASIWLPTTVKGVPVSNEDVGIYHLENFPTWEFEINFAPHMAKMSQNAMVDLVLMTVEPSSPVGEKSYNDEFGGTFNKKEGKYNKNFPSDIKEKLTSLEDGEYTLEF